MLLLFGFITVIFCLLCFFFSFLFRVKKRLKSVKDKDKSPLFQINIGGILNKKGGAEEEEEEEG